MGWKKSGYLLHRWLGFLVGVQMLAWSTGGLVFSLLDIDNVHGDLERKTDPPPPLRVDHVQLSPVDALLAAATQGIAQDTVCSVLLRERFNRTVYEFFGAEAEVLGAVDAASGEVLLTITEDQAQEAALADFAPATRVTSIALLEGDAPSEFRGGPMPVYQVILDHPKHPHLYVSPVTGNVLKRRNKPWRLFDFFWMLHIMDYGGRETFNHGLLTTMSLLAILTSLSGLLLWWWRLSPRLFTKRLVGTV